MKQNIETFIMSGKVILYIMLGTMLVNVLSIAYLILNEDLSYNIEDLITKLVLLMLIVLLGLFGAQLVRMVLYFKHFKEEESVKFKGIVITVLLIPLFVLVNFLTMVILALRSFS